MTVSTEISSNEYTGNGVTTDFDYKFRIFKANQLSVISSDADGDNVVTLRLGTDYTVTGANKSTGGKVILTRPLANGHKISIARDIPITQETSFRNQGKFLAETHEDAFDYLTMIIQRIWGSLGSLYLKRPNILANWFDAKGYRIANLGKPKRDSDAVDLGTLKDEISGVNSTILKREKRLLRVDDMDISALPKASERSNKQIGFDSLGIPTLLDPAETGALGYILVDSFEKGALITGRYQALHFEYQGEFYRWDGGLPKQVPAGSTPQSTGGIGKGAWVSVGDASLRSELYKYDGANNIADGSLTQYKKINTFKAGGTAVSKRDCFLHTDGFWYFYSGDMQFSVDVPPNTLPDNGWQCVGLLNGYDVDDLRNWGDIYTNDILSVLQTAYDKCESFITIPAGFHRITLTQGLDDYTNGTTLVGLQMRRENISVYFADNAEIHMNAITDPNNDGRYYIFYAAYAHNNKIVKPTIYGDRDSHAGTAGEQGYGIRNYNSSNLQIVQPSIHKCWGDGILWFVNELQHSGGEITGKGIYKNNRRQGISVISCNGLYIEWAAAYDTNGAPNGPFATIDVEPDHNYQFVIGLKIGRVEGYNSAGSAFLLALHQLDETSSPVDIEVGSVYSQNCLRASEARSDKKVKGIVNVNSIIGRDSKAQDFQTVMWSSTLQLNVKEFTSIDCNRLNSSSSQNAVGLLFARTRLSDAEFGNINFGKVTLINKDTTLAHPASMINTSNGELTFINIEELIYEPAKMKFGGALHLPAGNFVRIGSRIRKSVTGSETLSISEWINTLSNIDATSDVTVTVPAGYGYDGMLLQIDCETNNQIRVNFMDGIDGYPSGSDVRSRLSGAKIILRKTGKTWSVSEASSGDWSINGIGRLSYGVSIGGNTSNRPTNPKPWQTYFDASINKLVCYNDVTKTWVNAS